MGSIIRWIALYLFALAMLPVSPNRLLAGEVKASPTTCPVIPKPAKVDYAEGVYKFTEKTTIHVGSAELANIGRYLAELLAPASGLALAVDPAAPAQTGGIVLTLDAARKELGEEGYALACTTQGVTITGAKPAGVFYGVQTLRQLLPVEIESRTKVQGVEWTVPCVLIEDRPRFQWRGYLIDPARNFRTKSELKRCIDLLAFQKMNILQLHLTDDQGWRLEIRKYPKLVEVGARLRDYTGRKGEGWFYSQADIRELVAYAASRHVTLVPEIEMPGHSGAALTAYPELGCGGKNPGGWAAPLCISRPAAFEFVTNVLTEVMELFPSPYIHIGGDEAPFKPWRTCAQCSAAMAKLAGEKLPEDVRAVRILQSSGGVPYHEDIARLQGEFIRRVDAFLTAHGRRMVGWDEIIEGGLADSSRAIAMAWRGSAAVKTATGQNRDVITAPYPIYYLDNQTPVKATYGFQPAPPEATRVIGVQGNMWGERTPTTQRVDQQTFPRLCAIAEAGWTLRENRNYQDFYGRLCSFCKRLELLDVAYNGKFREDPPK